jgi:hypothetical protein
MAYLRCIFPFLAIISLIANAAPTTPANNESSSPLIQARDDCIDGGNCCGASSLSGTPDHWAPQKDCSDLAVRLQNNRASVEGASSVDYVSGACHFRAWADGTRLTGNWIGYEDIVDLLHSAAGSYAVCLYLLSSMRV